jgi:hypothetical protein
MTRTEFNPKEDGNVFQWILETAEKLREERREERGLIKQEMAKGGYKHDYKRHEFV